MAIKEGLGIDIARYESERRVSLIEERRQVELELSSKYAEIRGLMDRRNALVSEIISTINRSRYEPPTIAKPPVTDTPPRRVFLDRFMDRVTGSLKGR